MIPMNGRQIADALGVSEATISRLKDGERRPSLALMNRIKERAQWPLEDQVIALERGEFGRQLTERMTATSPDQVTTTRQQEGAQ